MFSWYFGLFKTAAYWRFACVFPAHTTLHIDNNGKRIRVWQEIRRIPDIMYFLESGSAVQQKGIYSGQNLYSGDLVSINFNPAPAIIFGLIERLISKAKKLRRPPTVIGPAGDTNGYGKRAQVLTLKHNRSSTNGITDVLSAFSGIFSNSPGHNDNKLFPPVPTD